MSMLENLTNLTAVPIVQSDSTVIQPTLKAIDILKAGTLVIVNDEDDEVTVVFPAVADGGSYPYRFWARVRKVMDTGTTLADAEMVGIR